MKTNPQTKDKMILNSLLIKPDLTTGEEIEEDPFFHSSYHMNLEGTNWGETFDEMGVEMIEKLENFNRRGSNWKFEKVLKLEIQFVKWKPLGGGSWLPLPDVLVNKKAIVNPKN